VRQLSFDELPREVREGFIRHHLQEQERVRRFGHVRPPIAVDHAGHKIVGVGSRLYWAKNWKTFHSDFKQPDAEIVAREYPAIKDLFDSVVQHTEVPYES
jgi:hypothetical protein